MGAAARGFSRLAGGDGLRFMDVAFRGLSSMKIGTVLRDFVLWPALAGRIGCHRLQPVGWHSVTRFQPALAGFSTLASAFHFRALFVTSLLRGIFGDSQCQG
jgi:hypothetical protein